MTDMGSAVGDTGRKAGRSAELWTEYGSLDFVERYEAAVAGERILSGAGTARTIPRSLSALIAFYYESRDYRGLKDSNVPPLDLETETPDCDYAASGRLSIWSRRNWAGERCPSRSISQHSL